MVRQEALNYAARIKESYSKITFTVKQKFIQEQRGENGLLCFVSFGAASSLEGKIKF